MFQNVLKAILADPEITLRQIVLFISEDLNFLQSIY